MKVKILIASSWTSQMSFPNGTLSACRFCLRRLSVLLLISCWNPWNRISYCSQDRSCFVMATLQKRSFCIRFRTFRLLSITESLLPSFSAPLFCIPLGRPLHSSGTPAFGIMGNTHRWLTFIFYRLVTNMSVVMLSHQRQLSWIEAFHKFMFRDRFQSCCTATLERRSTRWCWSTFQSSCWMCCWRCCSRLKLIVDKTYIFSGLTRIVVSACWNNFNRVGELGDHAWRFLWCIPKYA